MSSEPAAASSASFLPHLHLLLDKFLTDAELSKKLAGIAETAREAPIEKIVNARRVMMYPSIGLFIEFSVDSTDAAGLPVWKSSMVGVVQPKPAAPEALPPPYPGPYPQNLPLGSSRRSVLESLNSLKLRAVAGGVSHGSCLTWERFDFAPGEMKCAFSDGRRRPKDEAVRYSQALSNKGPVSLLLVYKDEVLVKSLFMTQSEAARVDEENSKAIAVCTPCRESSCPKKLLFSDIATRREIVMRESVYDVVFGRETCQAVHHEYRTDTLNIDVSVYGPDPQRNRNFFTLVTSGLSSQPFFRTTGRKAEEVELPPTASSKPISSAKTITAAAGLESAKASSVGAGPGTAKSLQQQMAAQQLQQQGQQSTGATNPDGTPVSRIELVLYTDDVKPIHISWLRHIARVATSIDPVLLTHGSTILCPEALQKTLMNGNSIESFLVLNAASQPENKLHEKLRVGNEPVKLMVVVPITLLERNRQHDIVEKLQKVTNPILVRENRPLYA